MEIHSARGKIHRLVPRENLEVNKFWMCDEGRFTYRAAEQDRFLLATVSGQRASLATAVSKGARLLEEALARDARKVGVVFSAGATNEDTHALARLALDGLKIGRAYLGGAPLGWSDNILVSADKNPNTAGVERIVPPPLLTLKDLAGDVASGAVSTLLVLGNASLVLPEGRLAAAVVLSSHQGPLVETANVALPVASWAEVEGSFTNRHGRVQRLNPALAARGDGLPAWRVAALLGHELSVDLAYTSAAEVFADASARHPFMQSLRWGPTARPTLLRFGASRG
jgi:NADH-quinone oxidoreductase subunit G